MKLSEVLSLLDRLEAHTSSEDAKLKRLYGPGATYYLAVIYEGPGKHIKVDKEYLRELKNLLTKTVT